MKDRRALSRIFGYPPTLGEPRNPKTNNYIIMKNRNRNNGGMTLLEMLIGIALVAVIALAVFSFTDRINPEGYETVNIERVLVDDQGVGYVMTDEGETLEVSSPAVAETLTKGDNRVKVERDAATGRDVIIATELSEQAAVAVTTHKLVPEGQKKTTIDITPSLPRIALILGAIGIGLVLAVFLLVKMFQRKPATANSDQSSRQVSESRSQVETPPAPPAAEASAV